MLEEVHLMPTADKTFLSFSQAALFLDNWFQKIEVAKNYDVSLEPQKLIAIVSRIRSFARMMEMIRGPDGNVDTTLSFDWHLHMRELGVRDGATLANVEMISKHLLATLRNRS
eukprot:5764235-Amphidinium_carterae.1